MTTFLLGLALGAILGGRLAWDIAIDACEAKLTSARDFCRRGHAAWREQEVARDEAERAIGAAKALARHEFTVAVHAAIMTASSASFLARRRCSRA